MTFQNEKSFPYQPQPQTFSNNNPKDSDTMNTVINPIVNVTDNGTKNKRNSKLTPSLKCEIIQIGSCFFLHNIDSISFLHISKNLQFMRKKFECSRPKKNGKNMKLIE